MPKVLEDYNVEVFDCSKPEAKKNFDSRITFLADRELRHILNMLSDLGRRIYLETNEFSGLSSVCTKIGQWDIQLRVQTKRFDAWFLNSPLFEVYDPVAQNYQQSLNSVMQFIFQLIREDSLTTAPAINDSPIDSDEEE